MRYKLVILSILVLTIFAAACSDNPALRDRYQAEKLLYEAEKLAQTTQVRPELTNAELLGQIRDSYGRVADYCFDALKNVDKEQHPTEYGELSVLAFKASGRLTQLFYLGRQFDTCVVICDRLLKEASLEGGPLMSTYLSLGRSLQAAGQWDSAQAVYDHAVETFYPPLEPNGQIMTGLFNLPAQIFQVYARVGDTVAAAMKLDQAIYYYRDLAKDFPDSRLATAAHASSAILYEQTGKPKLAIDELSQVTDSTGHIAPPAQEKIADLYAGSLKNYQQALTTYETLIASLTGADTVNIPGLEFKRVSVYIEMKKYDEAKEVLNRLKDDYPEYFAQNAVAQYAVARIFDLQGNWDRAETEYRYLLENYEDSKEAMSTYLYLAGRLADKGRRMEAQRIEEEADAAYKRIIADRPGTQDEANAMTYQAELFRRHKDWPEAAAKLSEVFRKFPYSEVGYRSAIAAASIYRKELNEPQRSDSLMNEIKKRLTTVDETAEF